MRQRFFLARLAPFAPFAIALLSGCSPATIAGFHPYATKPPPPVAEAMADVARFRGLPMTEPIDFEALDEQAFQRAARREMSSPRGTGATGKTTSFDHFTEAFTMGSGESVSRGARALYDAELGGFYDPKDRRLYLRGREGTTSTMGRFTLEHETEHALQDRAFGFPDLQRLPLDAALAVRALYEGDATLTAALVEAERSGTPAATAVANLVRFQDDLPLGRLTAATRAAPPLVRAELLWPYFGGTTFTAQLASAGGWSLLNAAFAHPPTTTEQVLHVEKYLAGEQAVEVATPPVPDGYEGKVRGTMGELATRVFLEQCSSDAHARDAAKGWGGDAFAVVAHGSEESLLWISVWDDAYSAARFVRALEERRVCARTGPKPDLTVVREGLRVAFIQGLGDENERRREAEVLFPLAGDATAPQPPFPSVSLARPRPPVQKDFVADGRIEGGSFIDQAIGLRVPLMGMTVERNPDVDLIAEGESLRVVVHAVWSPPSRALGDSLLAEFLAARKKIRRIDATQALEGDEKPVKLAWTTGTSRSLRIGDRDAVRLVLAPVCGGKMTLVLFARWVPESEGESMAETWFAAVQAQDQSPACDALKSLRDPEQK
jgi:hypothetical protein